MASKQTVTFTLTDAQAKKWTGILQSKEGVKKLTASLRELEKLKKYKEAQQIKKTNKKRLDIPTDQGFPVTASYK